VPSCSPKFYSGTKTDGGLPSKYDGGGIDAITSAYLHRSGCYCEMPNGGAGPGAGLPLFIFGLTENVWVFRGSLYVLLVLGVETLAHRMIVIYKGAAEKDAAAAADEA